MPSLPKCLLSFLMGLSERLQPGTEQPSLTSHGTKQPLSLAVTFLLEVGKHPGPWGRGHCSHLVLGISGHLWLEQT
jgi:hypothetical protein